MFASRHRAAAVFEKVTKVYPRRLDADPAWSRSTRSACPIGWGEVFGLIGPNRAGKTTLVKILLSICRPTRWPHHAARRALVRPPHAGRRSATCTRTRPFPAT